MSWSFTSQPAPKAQAREAFATLAKSQGAYTYDGPHKTALDEVAEFAGKIADAAPDGTQLALESYGHVDSNGVGNVSAKVTIGVAVAPVVEPEPEMPAAPQSP